MTDTTKKKARGSALAGIVAVSAIAAGLVALSNEGRTERKRAAEPAAAAEPSAPVVDTPPTMIGGVQLGTTRTRVKEICGQKKWTCTERTGIGRRALTRIRAAIPEASGGEFRALRIDFKDNIVFKIRADFRTESSGRRQELSRIYGLGSLDAGGRTKWVSEDRATVAVLSHRATSLLLMSLDRARTLGVLSAEKAIRAGFRFPLTPAVARSRGVDLNLAPTPSDVERSSSSGATRLPPTRREPLAITRLPERLIVNKIGRSNVELRVKNVSPSRTSRVSAALDVKHRVSGASVALLNTQIEPLDGGATIAVPFNVELERNAGSGSAYDAIVALGASSATVAVEAVPVPTVDLAITSFGVSAPDARGRSDATVTIRNVRSDAAVRYRVRFVVAGGDPIWVDGAAPLRSGDEAEIRRQILLNLAYPGDSAEVTARIEPIGAVDTNPRNDDSSLTRSIPFPPAPDAPEFKKIKIKFKLTGFKCVEQNEFWADEPILYATGMHSRRSPDRDHFSKSWDDVDDGETRELSHVFFGGWVDVSPFEAAGLHIAVWEIDPVYDDEIGYAYRMFRWDWVKARQGTTQTEEITFDWDDAIYRVSYQVEIGRNEALDPAAVTSVFPNRNALNPHRWAGTYNAVIGQGRSGELVLDRFDDTADARSPRQPWGKFVGRFVEGTGNAKVTYALNSLVTMGNYVEFDLVGFDKTDRANPRPQRFVVYLVGPERGRAIAGTTKTVNGLTAGVYMTKTN
ncbi:MAG: hypothetical protein HYY84_08755 [Deltaproteobacteria bacterium]|nr:hypothetical protein [Deltaproteobacteria bacterium]